MYVVGVDGCPGGWIAIRYEPATKGLTPGFHASFADIVASYPDAAAIGIDIPIGLSSDGPRGCDVEARKVLKHRRSSVFPAPHPGVLGCATYGEASAESRRLTGKGISRQCFGITPKIAEVDAEMTPERQGWVVEVHPEVSFCNMAGGRPMQYRKGTPAGYQERRDLISAKIGLSLPARDEARRHAPYATPDDYLDAVVAAWSAHRLAMGIARRLPEEPAIGSHGLRMEIVF